MVMGPVVPMARNKPILLVVLITVLGCTINLSAQMTGKTVRHHKQAVEDPSQAALTQAESAIEKKDYATAETSLQKLLERDAANYRAWFDLGFVYNATGKKEDSINAYRNSVAAKPDVFESNLNLGLMLARAGRPDAAWRSARAAWSETAYFEVLSSRIAKNQSADLQIC